MSTKLSQNVYDHKILDEPATVNVDQLVPNIVLMYVTVRS